MSSPHDNPTAPLAPAIRHALEWLHARLGERLWITSGPAGEELMGGAGRLCCVREVRPGAFLVDCGSVLVLVHAKRVESLTITHDARGGRLVVVRDDVTITIRPERDRDDHGSDSSHDVPATPAGAKT
jgi:hypothetical protein